MDAPASELRHLGHPAEITSAAVLLPGAAAPVVIPLDWLPAPVRARWLLADPRAPLVERVASAIDAGLDDEAFALLRARREPLMGPTRLDTVLDGWIRRQSTRLALPALRGECLVLGADGRWDAPRDATLGLNDARQMLAALALPRWRGAVLAVADGAPATAPATSARPALPVVRLDGRGSQREQAAGATALLVLDLSAPPAGGWPAWLRSGVDGVARAIARGEGPSPRAMHERRRGAGAAAIAALFAAATPDAELATAVCAPLLHSRRRHLLPNLLDPLRHGADAATALRIAYGLTPERLLEER